MGGARVARRAGRGRGTILTMIQRKMSLARTIITAIRMAIVGGRGGAARRIGDKLADNPLRWLG